MWLSDYMLAPIPLAQYAHPGVETGDIFLYTDMISWEPAPDTENVKIQVSLANKILSFATASRYILVSLTALLNKLNSLTLMPPQDSVASLVND